MHAQIDSEHWSFETKSPPIHAGGAARMGPHHKAEAISHAVRFHMREGTERGVNVRIRFDVRQ